MPRITALPLTLTLWAASAAPAQAAPLAPHQTIKVCGQDAEWPPYLYFQRSLGIKTEDLVGYSIEYLRTSLARKGLNFTMDMIPWRRCMESVKAGVYDMMTDTSSNAERELTYLVSKPYYAMHLIYFYDKSRSPPVVNRAADLKRLRLCGVNGYNYAPFGIQAGEIEQGAMNLGQSFLKLKRQRCDAVPERLEIALGYKAINVVDFDQLDIGFEYVPGLPPVPFHMMVSRNVPYATELLQVLDEGIEQLNSSGAGRQLASKYSIPGVDLMQTLPDAAKKPGNGKPR